MYFYTKTKFLRLFPVCFGSVPFYGAPERTWCYDLLIRPDDLIICPDRLVVAGCLLTGYLC